MITKPVQLELSKSVVIIVAHPDDETLWAGGTLLSNPSWECFVVCLCRGSDRDRAPKFHTALNELGATGAIADLDDGPDQKPLKAGLIESAILELLPSKQYDLIITHSPRGEYTRHRRHEEVGKAVIKLWGDHVLSTDALWCFAYEDGDRAYHPRPIKIDTSYNKLTPQIWNRKYDIITRTYGFNEGSWEAATTPQAEAFWQFDNAANAKNWANTKQQAKL